MCVCAGELEANLALGCVYEELADTPNALVAHERRLELASKNLMSTEMDAAYRSLTTVYLHKVGLGGLLACVHPCCVYLWNALQGWSA